MQILEAALAFAITMFVLSMISSAIVEMIHRVLSMREEGLKYVLEQVFDRVLAPHFERLEHQVPSFAGKGLDHMRESFVKRMRANRAPMGATPNDVTAQGTGGGLYARMHLWNGRELSAMTPTEFMERLGSSADFGKAIKEANEEVGRSAADAVDMLLKDVAQKFEAFGREASVYFEGRARLLSVLVAIVLAFAIRADAIDIFNTYLRDPTARNTVIEQTKAVTAQHEAATKAAEALKAISASNQQPDVQAHIDALKKEWQATVDNTRATVKQYADLGLPIGWTKENATLTVGTFFSIVFGGILIGLGGPFWYGAVTGLANIRTIANELFGGGSTKGGQAVPVATTSADQPQPSTPVGAFKVAAAAAI